MTDRELLKEARDVLEGFLGPYVGAGTGPKDLRALQNRIDEHLADHSPDTGNMVATEIVRRIRETDWNIDFSERVNTLTDAEAAALIEQYGRRVPREMLEEIERKACRNGDIGGCSCLSLNNIAAKYGVKIEEDGK